jgi:hypothetical protein
VEVRNVSGDGARNGYIRMMDKRSSATRSSSAAFVRVNGGAKSGDVITTKLGNVTVTGTKPSLELVKSNVARSTQALERVGKKLMKPGVYLPEKKGVPRYSADENNPRVIIQRLDGRTTIGRLQDGRFVETK